VRNRYVWTWEGSDFPGWPQAIDNSATDARSSCVVGSVDDDPEVEISMGSSCGKVYAFDVNGDILTGWPIQTDAEVHSTPTLADLDQDGDIEVIVSGMDQVVYVWDCEGSHAEGDGIEWSTFLHDPGRNSRHGGEAPVGISDEDSEMSGGLMLEQNVPNPFRPATTIGWTAPVAGTRVKLLIYDVAGRLVRTLVDGESATGRQVAAWDGRDAEGRLVTSGIYFVRLSVDGRSATRKLAVLK
jgi:hypothetical protein